MAISKHATFQAATNIENMQNVTAFAQGQKACAMREGKTFQIDEVLLYCFAAFFAEILCKTRHQESSCGTAHRIAAERGFALGPNGGGTKGTLGGMRTVHKLNE